MSACYFSAGTVTSMFYKVTKDWQLAASCNIDPHFQLIRINETENSNLILSMISLCPVSPLEIPKQK
jgi:hypothetical protein